MQLITSSNEPTKPRTVLLIVLPYAVRDPSNSTTEKQVRSFIGFPYGALTIASYLKTYTTADIHLFDLNLVPEKTVKEYFITKIAELEPDIIGYSMSYDISFPWLQELTKLVPKLTPKTIQVAGGPAVTTAYKEVLEDSTVDAICYGEGERGLKNLVIAENPSMELKNDPWFTLEHFKTGAQPKTLYEDLDLTVDVDYSLVNVDAYSMKEAFSPFTKFSEDSRQFFLVTSRGCPFKCVFCAEPSFHGANMRYVDVDKVVNHVRHLVDNYGLNVLTIYDDQILMNRDRAKSIFRGLADLNIRIELPNGVTLSYIDAEMAALMKSAGVDTIFLAIESGVPRVLREIIKKPLAYNRVKSVIQELHKNDIFVGSFFVLGLPDETPEERFSNLDFIKESEIDWAFFNFATPLRGSELFKKCLENEWIDKKYEKLGAMDMSEYVITNAPGMNPKRIKRDLLMMNLEANFVNNRRMNIGDYKTAKLAFEEVISRHPNQPFAHYYLAQAEMKMGAPDSIINAHLERFNNICEHDQLWSDLAKYYDLITGPPSSDFFGYEAKCNTSVDTSSHLKEMAF
jgi:anaerobic magnesium-protoporphyrin IX monomethyl ester cyclase